MEDAQGPTKDEWRHERRLLQLEREFEKGGRVTMLEEQLAKMSPGVDELLLARRVTAGVNAELDKREAQRDEQQTTNLNRWQKLSLIVGIPAAIVGGIAAGIAAILQAAGHG